MSEPRKRKKSDNQSIVIHRGVGFQLVNNQIISVQGDNITVNHEEVHEGPCTVTVQIKYPDGKESETEHCYEKPPACFQINVNGNATHVSTTKANVHVQGHVTTLESVHGDVTIGKDVHSCSSTNGDVTVNGNIDTLSGVNVKVKAHMIKHQTGTNMTTNFF